MIKTIKIISIILLITCIIILSDACKDDSRDGKIKVGALFALTGTGADWGQDEAEATRLAFEEVNKEGGINKQEVELILENAPAEDVNTSVTAFQKLLNVHKTEVVLGPTWDDVAAALAPLAERKKVVIIAPDSSSGIEREISYDYFFSVFAPERSEMRRLVQFLKEKEIKRIATVYNLDPFSKQWHDTFVDAVKEYNMEIEMDFPVSDPDAKDFRSQILQLKEGKMDAVYVEFTSQDNKGPFMRQAKELKLESIIVSSSTTDTQSLLDNYGQYLEDLTIASPKQTEEAKEFAKNFEERYNHPPRSPAAPYAYDAAKILIEVLKQNAKTSDGIKNALYQIKNFKGVTAPNISFDKMGRVVWPNEVYEMKSVKENKFVVANE